MPLTSEESDVARKSKEAGTMSGLSYTARDCYVVQEHPLVEPQVSHFRQVPLRTIVKLPHSEQLSPS